MAKKRVISECINVRINVGNYQHIEITKQASQEIEYSSEDERLELEEVLTNDIVDSVIKSMRSIPSRLGKGLDQAQEVEEAISKAIPEWLNNCPPNLMDRAKDKVNKIASEQKDNKDRASEDILDVKETPSKSAAVFDDEDLFEEDDQRAEIEVVKEPFDKPTVSATKSSDSEASDVEDNLFDTEDDEIKETVVKSSGAESDDFDFFDDEDLDLFKDV